MTFDNDAFWKFNDLEPFLWEVETVLGVLLLRYRNSFSINCDVCRLDFALLFFLYFFQF